MRNKAQMRIPTYRGYPLCPEQTFTMMSELQEGSKRAGFRERRHPPLDCSRFVPPRAPSPQGELF